MRCGKTPGAREDRCSFLLEESSSLKGVGRCAAREGGRGSVAVTRPLTGMARSVLFLVEKGKKKVSAGTRRS